MNQRISCSSILSVLVLVLLGCGVAAAAAATPVSGSGGATLPAETDSGRKSDTEEPVTISISVDRHTATNSLRSAPILISADLDRDGEPVPDGTIVNFGIISGSGTLSGVTSTVDGIATVMLSSTTVGSVVVSATAGSASASISAAFLAQPKQALVKVATVGTLPSGTTIGSLIASVTYPVKGYGIASGGVSPSGVAGGATTTLAANIETAGQVILALLDVGGITTGEFATLSFQVADGYLPDRNDFSVTPAASVISAVSNAAIPGIDVVVQSLTLR